MKNTYVIYKTFTDSFGKKIKILVNDQEGIPYEFECHLKAKKIAEDFQKKSKHGSLYEVKEI
jgi:hypothetical protein